MEGAYRTSYRIDNATLDRVYRFLRQIVVTKVRCKVDKRLCRLIHGAFGYDAARLKIS